MIKIAAISDLHGQLPEEIEKCDYLLIAGDIVPLKIQCYSKESKAWFSGEFMDWAKSLPVNKKIICTAGNHDFWAERHGDELKKILFDNGMIYLENDFWADENIEVYGSPLCKPFGNWAFMRPIDIQEEAFGDIHFKHLAPTTILLTHDAPFGVSDIILQKNCMWADGRHIGNKALTTLVEREQPDYMLHGHLHSTNHDVEYIGKTEVRCVSLLDEDYLMAYRPTYLEI